MVSIELAVEHPDRVRRLVLVDAGGVSIGSMRLGIIACGFMALRTLVGHKPILDVVARRTVLRRAALRAVRIDPAGISAVLATELFPGFASPGFTDAVYAGTRYAAASRVRELSCAVVLIWGERDRLLPVDLAYALAAQVPGARVEVVPGAGHCPMFEAPDLFNRIALSALHD
jgi:pimeloyl-ACP methyl ester carboxylesterase